MKKYMDVRETRKGDKRNYTRRNFYITPYV